MASSNNIGFALVAFREMNFSMKLREMETHYEKNVKERVMKQYQPEASAPLSYQVDLIFEEKERIFKEIYPSIKMFDRLIYEVRNKIESDKNKKISKK